MQLFYNATITSDVKEFNFPEDESKHIIKVLRKKEGAILKITNGKGYLFNAKILDANPKKCKVEISTAEKTVAPLHKLHIAVAPTKMNDRLEWFLEKATEIGIHEITPILCDHSERKVIKPERLEKVIQSAMKQSLQTYLPKLNPLTTYKDFLENASADVKFIAHCEENKKVELKTRLAANKDVIILIGPEGDFSSKEIQLSHTKGYIPVSLGKNRLRTETAAIYACTIVSIINN